LSWALTQAEVHVGLQSKKTWTDAV